MSPFPNNESPIIRRTSHFSGTVQGVGFRATASSVASHFRVTGFVRNLPDGRVELVAEGSRAELDRYHAALIQALHAHIEAVSSIDAAATGQFTSFTIAR